MIESAKIKQYKKMLTAADAVLIAHYYTDAKIQYLAEQTGGFVGDSLAMAKFGVDHPAKTLIIAGVRFMGESAKILSPEKKVIVLTLEAECSLDLGCPINEFSQFCDENPDRTVVVYCNTSAAVKARADWVVTSTNALSIVDHLDAEGKKILWAPDKHLGRYIQKQTGADMLLWNAACVVHEEFQTTGLKNLQEQYPDAAILVHPESPEAVIDIADVVGSTTVLLKASQDLPNKTFLVATDSGIFYKMQQASPEKNFILMPTGGNGATCKSCGSCPWMAMNTLERFEACFSENPDVIELDKNIIARAQIPLKRMLDFRI